MYIVSKREKGLRRPNQKIICYWTKNNLEEATNSCHLNSCHLKWSKRRDPEINDYSRYLWTKSVKCFRRTGNIATFTYPNEAASRLGDLDVRWSCSRSGCGKPPALDSHQGVERNHCACFEPIIPPQWMSEIRRISHLMGSTAQGVGLQGSWRNTSIYAFMVQREQGSRGGNRGRKDKWLRLGEIWQVKAIGHEIWLLGMV